MIRSFLALGSNVGDRQGHLKAALEGLAENQVPVVRCASLYLTAPKGYLEQRHFLNTVIEVATLLEPLALMGICLQVEESRRRQRGLPNRPRTLDIDIILSGDRIVKTDQVTIPHPRYTERRFVLEPLAEIAADFLDPVRRLSVRELLDQVQDNSDVRRFAEPLA